MFRQSELQILISRPGSAKGIPFEFGLGSRLVQEMGSFAEKSKNLMTQTNTPKSVEEVVIEVMQADKAIELFQTMVIKSQNMGNLNMEVNNLKNKLATREKETTIL